MTPSHLGLTDMEKSKDPPMWEKSVNCESDSDKDIATLSVAEIHNLVYFSENFKIYGCNLERLPDNTQEVSFTVELSHMQLLGVLSKFDFRSVSTKTHLEALVVKTGLTRFCVNFVVADTVVTKLFPEKVSLLLSKSQVYKGKQMLLNIEGGSSSVTVTPNGYLTHVPGSEVVSLVNKLGKSPTVRSMQYFTPLAPYAQNYSNKTRVISNQLESPVKLYELPRKITHQLSLTRSKVTYLIGKNGEKIQELRKSSNCYIKVLEYSGSNAENLFQSRKNLVQDILIHGYKPDVEKVIKCISRDLARKNA
ncbi:hypothetical protein CLIB1423_09S03180 [[Candida] railenensis]|uniref:K Homology domain-containing protein n=1 Tax=[Candida] railenensis TaxID=45579 RepID=A0A9P0QPK4_9ASCO|nr:hypothetical protein CLIB1423_09S03180 [[Candida] railenensis]